MSIAFLILAILAVLLLAGLVGEVRRHADAFIDAQRAASQQLERVMKERQAAEQAMVDGFAVRARRSE